MPALIQGGYPLLPFQNEEVEKEMAELSRPVGSLEPDSLAEPVTVAQEPRPHPTNVVSGGSLVLEGCTCDMCNEHRRQDAAEAEKRKMFATGTHVKYTSGQYGDSADNPLWGGRQGYIEGVATDGYSSSVNVRWSNGYTNGYQASALVVITEEDKKLIGKPPPPPPPPKFKLGNMVKYVRNGSYGDSSSHPLWGGVHGCMMGKVELINDSAPYPGRGYNMRIRWQNGLSYNMYEYSLEPITAKDKRLCTYKVRKPLDVAKIGTVKIKAHMHDKFTNDLKMFSRVAHKPFCYMVGVNKKGTISDAELLASDGNGCSQMPSYQSTELNKAMFELSKRNITPCGLARIGSFIKDSGSRGGSLRQIGWAGESALILSFSIDWMEAETYCIKTEQTIKLPYAVVK